MELKKQNILFLTRTMNLGGTENVILQLCEILKPLVNKIIVCSCGGINEEKLKELNIKHINIYDMENKSPIKILKNIKIIKKIIKEENITIIHSHHRMAAMYANICANKNIKKIANAHNTFYDKKILTKLAYKNTKIIAVGNQVKNNLIDFYDISNDNITVIYNGIKEFKENITEELLFKTERLNNNKIILNIGRLSEQKGMEYFIRASKLVLEKNNNVKFYIIGTGEDENKLKQLVKDLNLEKFVIFMGYRNDIQNLISQCDFVVLSSLWEGLPLTPIETFSVGKTIIATSVDGTREIVQDGINGLLVESKDINSLADAINYLIDNPSSQIKMEKNALNKYKTELSFDILKQNYIKYYKELE